MDELILSFRGQWVEIDFNGKSHSVVGLATAVAMQPDIALFFCRW
jgi:hypothetical protein